MINKLGIIPAGGNARRFRGIPKELLPLPDGRSMLEHALERLAFCDKIVVVTNKTKRDFHKMITSNNDKVYVVLQNGDEMFAAWRTVLSLFNANRYYMTMPDTFTEFYTFERCPENVDFALGVFQTFEPERFGVLSEGGIVDKDEIARVPATAWGVLAWSQKIAQMWRDQYFANYTDAINAALEIAGLHTWNMSFYFDIADVNEYDKLWEFFKKHVTKREKI